MSLELVRDGDAQALVRAGEAALAGERCEEALGLLRRAERAGAEPDRCAGNRWLAYMLLGDLKKAWCEGDAIRLRGAADPHRFWNGEDPRGKRVILRSLHGFGDAVQMFRFLPRLRDLAEQVIVEVPPRLLELAPCFEGMGEVITWGEQAPRRLPAWDLQMELMELPYALRISLEELSPQGGYLHLPLALQAEVAEAMGRPTRPRVGVVSTAGHWNPTRSIPQENMEILTGLQGLEFWNLEHGHKEPAKASFAGWRDVGELGDGIPRLAAAIEQLDLVITVDTLAAHLAGALGVPCWVLLQHRADWRWMRERTDSPWYPSLRLWRQSQAGDWASLLSDVARELQSLCRRTALP